MDELGLATLRAELEADCAVLGKAASAARNRLGNASIGELEACAFQLVRFYNVLEQAALRVAKAFENHIDDERGWHTELIRRLSLRIEGVRPPLFPAELMSDLQDVRGFRHIVVHAYELEMKGERVVALVEAAGRISTAMPALVGRFLEEAATMAEL